MRQFASTGFRIWNLSREAKLVYTFFGVFALAAIGSSGAFYEDLVGGGESGIRAYYAGESPPSGEANGSRGAAAGSRAGGPVRGPSIELPGDDAPGAHEPPAKLTVAVSYRKLLEVTHFHLFTVPVYLLIVAHLFMLTGLSSRAKAWWITGGFVSALVHLAAPWVVRYGGGSWAWLYAASGTALGVTCLVLTAYPIGVMWLVRPTGRGGPLRDRVVDEPL